jgi:putative PIN family toxin of toxin-antitoxin system
LRVVLDTAVVVSALLFESGRLRYVRDAWTAGRLEPLVSRETTTELLRVLGFPRFDLSSKEIEAVLSAYLPFVEAVDVAGDLDGLPRCSDPDDQIFVELAHVAEAEALVTGDRALLAMKGSVAFEILRPGELRTRLSP